MSQANKIPYKEQVAELAREIALRRSVYPRLVNQGRLRVEQARIYQRRMIAAKKTVERQMVLEAVSEEICPGKDPVPLELLHDENSLLGRLRKILQEAKPEVVWAQDKRTHKAIYELLLEEVSRWSEPVDIIP